MNNWKIVSFYTLNYKPVAEKYLIPSLKKLSIEPYIICVPNLNNWKTATDYKATFVQECLNGFKEDIVWIDCDATVNYYPELFDNIPIEYDIGVHYFDPTLFYDDIIKPPHVASGTIFIRNNEKIKILVNEWIENTKYTRWEQMALQLAIEHNSTIKNYNLPRSHCYINSQPNGKPPRVIIEQPVIEHFQASREMRNKK